MHAGADEILVLHNGESLGSKNISLMTLDARNWHCLSYTTLALCELAMVCKGWQGSTPKSCAMPGTQCDMWHSWGLIYWKLPPNTEDFHSLCATATKSSLLCPVGFLKVIQLTRERRSMLMFSLHWKNQDMIAHTQLPIEKLNSSSKCVTREI